MVSADQTLDTNWFSCCSLVPRLKVELSWQLPKLRRASWTINLLLSGEDKSGDENEEHWRVLFDFG